MRARSVRTRETIERGEAGVGLFTRGGNASRMLRKSLDGDMRALEQLGELFAGMAADGSFDLQAYSVRGFDLQQTRDIGLMVDRGIDGHEFYKRELAPNWNGLTREQRAAKIASFVRFANMLTKQEEIETDGIAELAAAVRTKIVMLATAYDVTYDDTYRRLIARNPGSFGDYALPSALAS